MTSGTKYWIQHDDPMAYNVPGLEPAVKIKKASLGRMPDKLKLKPYSITIYRWDNSTD
jgi:hypothetical protein